MDTWNGNSSQVTVFRNNTGITFPICLRGSSVATQYQTTYDRGLVIDQDGILRYKGTANIANNINAIKSMIQTLLAPTAIGPDQEAPESFSLSQNYPNPFNPSTTIRFNLPESERISLRIYNSSGALIRTLLDVSLNAGTHEISWDARNQFGQAVAAGVYFYTMETASFQATEKMILLR